MCKDRLRESSPGGGWGGGKELPGKGHGNFLGEGNAYILFGVVVRGVYTIGEFIELNTQDPCA